MGSKIFHSMAVAPKAVNIKGAVSPKTRDTAKRIPVKRPPKAEGSRTRTMTVEYDAPKANPASFNEPGNIFKVSSVERIINGSINIAKEIPPAKPE